MNTTLCAKILSAWTIPHIVKTGEKKMLIPENNIPFEK